MKYEGKVKEAFDKYYAYISSLDYYNTNRDQKMIRTRLYNKFIKECDLLGLDFSEASAHLGLKK